MVYGISFFSGSAFLTVSVVMPLWALHLGASPIIIGLIISSRQLLVVTLSIHGGALLDRFGVRNILVALGVAGAAATLLFPALPFIWAVIPLQMIAGIAESITWIGAQALVGKVLKGHPVYTGRMTAIARVGGFFGPVLAGLSWEFIGPYGAFGFLALWGFSATVVAWFLPEAADQAIPATAEPEPSQQSRAAAVMPRLSDYRTTFRLLLIPAVALVIANTFARQTGSGIQSSFYGIWLIENGFTASTIGLLFGIANATSAVAALTIGPLTRRFAEHWLLIAMTILAVVSIAITPMLGTFALLAIAIAIRGIGQGLNFPLMVSLAARSVGLHLQGRVAALRLTFNRFGGALVPFAMGALAEFIGLEYAFYLMGILGVVLLSLLGLWVSLSPEFANKEPPPQDRT